MSSILELRNIEVSYGPIRAVRDVSFCVEQGEIVTILGANGAGKTSILRAIAGLHRPSNGEILLRGERIDTLAAHRIAGKKLSLVPEGRGIFLNLTVLENLDLGAWTEKKRELLPARFEQVYSLFPRLAERKTQSAGTLSGGEQQMLAIGRALMSNPELLLLDEPSLGLAPQLIEKIFEIIQAINREGATVLLVEQNASQALRIAHRGLVLETGELKLAGAAEDLLNSDAVKKAYLGG